jgi:hypothetical protein
MFVNEQIISVLDYMCEKLGIVIDWTADNMLPYVTELLTKFIRYEIATSIGWCVWMLILTIIPYILFNKFHPKAKEEGYDPDVGVTWFAVASCVVLIAMSICTVIVFSIQIFDIIECVTFPEKFIADYAMNLMKAK